MPIVKAESQLRSPVPQARSGSHKMIIGIYGISGSGKSYLLNQLKQELDQTAFSFYEGSEVIARLVPGGLDAFQRLSEEEKGHWRRLAISQIRTDSASNCKISIVSGHAMFWSEEDGTGHLVCTQDDLDTFTHILYLDVPADSIASNRSQDVLKRRQPLSIEHLKNWREAEKKELRKLCYDNGVLFATISDRGAMLTKAITILRNFQIHTEEINLRQVETKLDEMILEHNGDLETMLVLDADKTLAAEDTGSLFWKAYLSSRPSNIEDPLLSVFNSPLGYSYTAFQQAALLYDGVEDESEFELLCEQVASAVKIHPEFSSLLRAIRGFPHVSAMVATCGLCSIWNKVLNKEGLGWVKVIGAGRMADGFVVTADVKIALVARLQDAHGLFVWAFGDSPLDLGMMARADQAVVVTGEVQSRSKSMDVALSKAIHNNELQAQQALLPPTATPRLSTIELPIIWITSPEFLDLTLSRRQRVNTFHLTDENTAKILMSPMRNAAVFGPALREAHRQTGWYLAIQFLPDIIGLEEYSVSHVQGRRINAYRLFNEQQTCIVALMRGGEPMAFGVNEAFPSARLVHAKYPKELLPDHLQGCNTVVLVDSVVNSGKSVVEFIRHIRHRNSQLKIIVITGVAQAEAVSGDGTGTLSRAVGCYRDISLVALRISSNKFTGSGTTDTGNRLFNTTHLH